MDSVTQEPKVVDFSQPIKTYARRRHERLATDLSKSLNEDTVTHILSYNSPKLGAFPGRVYTLSGESNVTAAAAAQSGPRVLSLKSILAPRRQRVIKVPGDFDRLEDAVAASQDGDVVLVKGNSTELQAPIIAPPHRLTIAGATKRRYGGHNEDHRQPNQEFNRSPTNGIEQPPGDPEVHVNTRAFPGQFVMNQGIQIMQTSAAAIVASGPAVRLDLRGIAWMGLAHADDASYDVYDEDNPAPAYPWTFVGLDAKDGARVTVENCWFQNFAEASVRAGEGAEVYARDITVDAGRFGVVAEGGGTSAVVENSLFNGRYVSAVRVLDGARLKLRGCRIDHCAACGMSVEDAGSKLFFDRPTIYMSRPGVQFDGEQYWPGRFHLHPGGEIICPNAVFLECDFFAQFFGNATATDDSNFDLGGLRLPERLREKGVFDKMKWYLAQFPHHTYTLTAHGEFPVASYVNASPERVWRDRHGQPFVLA